MDCVFKTGNLEELRNILSDDLQFRGPLFNFNSADTYVDSLRNDPPEDFEYEIIKSCTDDLSACLIYQFSKPDVSTTMAQTFETIKGKINNMMNFVYANIESTETNKKETFVFIIEDFLTLEEKILESHVNFLDEANPVR